jgi:hypothetical protein
MGKVQPILEMMAVFTGLANNEGSRRIPAHSSFFDSLRLTLFFEVGGLRPPGRQDQGEQKTRAV